MQYTDQTKKTDNFVIFSPLNFKTELTFVVEVYGIGNWFNEPIKKA